MRHVYAELDGEMLVRFQTQPERADWLEAVAGYGAEGRELERAEAKAAGYDLARFDDDDVTEEPFYGKAAIGR